MAYQPKKKFNNSYNDENAQKIALGKFMHICDNDLVLVLTNKDIPFPNSPVFLNNNKVGVVDEVFGQMDDTYLSVKLDKVFDIKKYKKDDEFYAFDNKFIRKERFLSRDEVQKDKEKKDKINGKQKESFNKKREPFIKKNDKYKSKGNFNNKSDKFSKFNDQKRRYNDNANKYDNKERNNKINDIANKGSFRNQRR